MHLMKAGVLFGVLLLFSSCSGHKSFALHAYQMTLPDNTVLQLPESFSLRDFNCVMDNTFCFGNDNTPVLRIPKRGGIYLWRI